MIRTEKFSVFEGPVCGKEKHDASGISRYFIASEIDHLHYDVTRAKPDGSCSRPAETGPSVL